MLTRRGISVITSVLLLTIYSGFTLSHGFIVASMLLLGLLLVDFIIFGLSSPALGHLEVDRKVSSNSVLVGDEFSYDLVFKNRSHRSIGPLMIRDHLPGNLDVVAGVSTVEKVQRWEEQVLKISVEAVEMGLASFDKLDVRLFDRLGLLWASRTYGLKTDVRVYPTLRRVVRRAKGGRRLVYRPAGTVVWRRRLLSEFAGVREYSPGDDHRLIAWKAMAKSPSHNPMTKELEDEVDADVVIVIANRSTMADGVRGARKLDKAVEAALAVAREASRTGHRASVLTYRNSAPRLVTGSPVHLAEQVYDIGLHPRDDLIPLVEAALRIRSRPCLVLALLDSPYPKNLEDGLFAPIMLSGFLLKVILLDTPSFFQKQPVQGRGASLATSLLKEREEAHMDHLLSSLGEERVDVRVCGPDDVAETAVEIYAASQGMFRR